MKFSVIIPAYNAQDTIVRCVDSLAANQCEAELEIIIIEDCSQDGTWMLCEQLAARYPFVTCLRNERNCGVSYTRNRGLQAATGEYILFTDSDDWVEPDYIASFQRAIEETRCDFAVCGFINHDEKRNGRTDVYAWPELAEICTVRTQDELRKLYDRTLLQQLWNKVFVREQIRRAELQFDQSISIGEDLRFILHYLHAVKPENVALINRPLYHYMRDQEGSLMYRVGYESVEEPIKNLRLLYELLGMRQEEIETALRADRQRQIELYAYLIYHNAGMREREKRRLILSLDEKQGEKLYWNNRYLYLKERLAIHLQRWLH